MDEAVLQHPGDAPRRRGARRGRSRRPVSTQRSSARGSRSMAGAGGQRVFWRRCPSRWATRCGEGLARGVTIVRSNLAEIHSLMNQALRRLDLHRAGVAPRARTRRIDDLAVLVNLVSCGLARDRITTAASIEAGSASGGQVVAAAGRAQRHRVVALSLDWSPGREHQTPHWRRRPKRTARSRGSRPHA